MCLPTVGPETSDKFTLHLIQEKVRHLSTMKNSYRQVGGRKKLTDVCPVIGAILSDLKTSDTFRLRLIQEKVRHFSTMKNS